MSAEFESAALITVDQLPVITERLQSIREEIDRAVLDAAAMVCTEDTIQAVKAKRAELRKLADALDQRRKAVKKEVLRPYEAFENVYQSCVVEPFRRADDALKGKIAAVENVQREECEKRCREYFAELCAVHCVPWLKYEQAGLRISLTEAKRKTPSGHFDKLSEFVSRVACDVDAIGSMGSDEGAAVMAEYRTNGLNLAKAQKTIRDRLEAVEQERRTAEERAEIKRREANAVAKVEAAAAPPVVVQAPAVVETPVPVVETPVPVVETPVPVVEKLLTVTFKATATRERLIALREWMKTEGIKYE